MRITGLIGSLLLLSATAFGGTLCVNGPLSGLLGTTCDIGSVEFTFSTYQFFSSNDSNQLDASQINVAFGAPTPSTAGFSLTGNFSLSRFDPSLDYSSAQVLVGYTSAAIGSNFTLAGMMDAGSGVTATGSSALVEGSFCQDLSCTQVVTRWEETGTGGSAVNSASIHTTTESGYLDLYYSEGDFASTSLLRSLGQAYMVVDPPRAGYDCTPEPASLVLFGLGLLSLALTRVGKLKVWRQPAPEFR